jgi:hypothetical protein
MLRTEVGLPSPADTASPENRAEAPKICGGPGRDERSDGKTGAVKAAASNQDHNEGQGERMRSVEPRQTRAQTAARRERMLIVIEALKEHPIYHYAAAIAGIHRKTLEYWLKCSEAGHDGYEIEWQGFTLPFHEHCETARDIADGLLDHTLLEMALGVKTRIEDGELIEEVVGPRNAKMMRFFLTRNPPNHWRINSSIDPPPRTGGVLVIGGATKQPQTCPTASIRARQWKSLWKKVNDAKS